MMSAALITAARELRDQVARLRFPEPVAYVYNPLDYAWAGHEAYLKKYGHGGRRAMFLGMNPGPFGMAQTGVPFGEVAAVRDWLGINVPIQKPNPEHPKRPVEGFACARAEVSGQRLWGLFASRFPQAGDFFRDYFVVNYCPLVFMEESGRNLTPDKLPARQTAELYAACDAHLKRVIETLQPQWLIGVGDFAQKRAESVFSETPLKIGKILHPSPASPAANRGWALLAEKQLKALEVW